MDVSCFSDRGVFSDICVELSDVIGTNHDDAKQILTYLFKNRVILSEREAIKHNTPQLSAGTMSLTNLQQGFYVNVKYSTIYLCALLLDISLSNGAAILLTQFMGVPMPGIVRLNEKTGEKCIVKETLALPDKVGHKKLLSKFNNDCCNHDLICKYRLDNTCLCSQEEVEAIYENLCRAYMFKKVGELYKYQW